MRALKKIIFINSAHIRYAEVKVDGNVHFIGTQGVGKSTLLRAILFFYNADKQHLGIPREKKPFDEFYLPHANSYIVYEVENDLGPYSILVNRSSYGRASYRFIDASFDRSWLIDEHGEVTADQKTLNQRLGKLSWRRIEDYSRYRDIIYGNSREAGKDMVRYHLIEARRYQNIYRSIQNVFLNSRLDADFIKDIIIRSMNDEEISINLGYYRNQVADFEQEYSDISCWYHKNPKGETPVRIKAANVIEAYHGLLYLRTRIHELCGELNYSIRATNEAIPQIEVKTARLNDLLQREKRLLSEIQEKYDKEKSKQTERKGVLEHQIAECKRRREHYEHLDIDNVLERGSHENELKGELQALERRLSDLTSQYSDITTKYKRLVESEESRFATFLQAQQQQIIDSERQAMSDKEKLAADHDRQREDIDQSFAERIESDNRLIESIRIEIADCRQSLTEARHLNPYAEQISEIQDELHALDVRANSIEADINATEAERDKMQSDIDLMEAQIKTECDIALSEKRRQIQDIDTQIAEIDKLLSRTKGSFYQWLEDNVAGWANNIGKIIDEDHVLYQPGLKPRLENPTEKTLYGVSIDLSDLPIVVRLPEQLKAQKDDLINHKQKLTAECDQIQNDCNERLKALSKKYSPRMRELREKVGMLEVERNILPGKIKAAKVKLRDLQEKTATEREKRRQELQTRQQEIAQRLEEALSKLEKTKSEKDKQRKAIDKAYNERKAQIDSILKALKAKSTAEIKERTAQKTEYLTKLSRQESEELKGKGADDTAVNECKNKIAEIKDALRYIEEKRELVISYKKDKAELLDHEGEYRIDLKNVKERIARLDEKFSLRRIEHQTRIQKYEDEISQLHTQAQRLTAGLRKANTFMDDSLLCPPMLHEITERKTTSSVEEVIDNLKSLIFSRGQRVKKFQETINEFKAFFGPKNTFNFRTTFTCEDDYMDFAANLDDFIQNNKIEEYRSRVNERYIEILRRASKEMGDMTRHESEIERIINDINNDFRDKNFVGVIKLIALHLRDSSDSIVQMLKRIKDFHDENRDELGEVTLFTTERRDEVNRKAVDYLIDFMKILNNNTQRQELALSDLFQLEFRVIENDNDTGWVSKLSHVGSEGTDTLVKAMVNIMLINVFKQKVSKRTNDFLIHCMMDEIGKLHPQNIKGILEFANSRNILLINSSPTTTNVSDYRYTYLLDKDSKSRTIVHPLISQS